jgi:hypothetical protein
MRPVGPVKSTSAALAIVLLIAQTGALAHAYEHNPGSPLAQVCASCIAGQALGAACVDSEPHFGMPVYKSIPVQQLVSVYASVQIPLTRQRAPPSPF